MRLYISSKSRKPYPIHITTNEIVNMCACKSVTVTTRHHLHIARFFVPLIFYIYNDKIHALLILCLWYAQTHVLSLCVYTVCFGEFMVTHRFARVCRPCTPLKEKLCVASALLHTHVPVWARRSTVHIIYIENSLIYRQNYKPIFVFVFKFI